MINMSHALQQIAQKTAMSIFVGVLLWVALLLKGSAALRSHHQDGIYEVTFGPLLLNTIQKEKTAERTTAVFSFESGLVAYLVLWIVIGIVMGVLFGRVHKDTDQPN